MFNSTKKWNYKWGLTCWFMCFYGGLKHLTFQANNFGVLDLESVDKIPISGQGTPCRFGQTALPTNIEALFENSIAKKPAGSCV